MNDREHRTEIRFGGFGGQGIVLAGTLLGTAASLHDGKEAVLTRAYGPEARGGASNTDVIISDTPVDYPFVSRLDVFVALFQEAFGSYRHLVRDTGLVIVEADLVDPRGATGQVYLVPAIRTAESLGNRLVMNMVALGFMLGLTDVVSRNAIEAALRDTVHKEVLGVDRQALDAGYELANKAKPA